MTKQEQDKFVEFYKEQVNLKKYSIRQDNQLGIDRQQEIICALQDLAWCLDFDLQTACGDR